MSDHSQAQSSLPIVEYPLEVLAPRRLAAPPIDRFSVSQFTTYRWSMQESIDGFESSNVPAIGIWRAKLDDLELYETAALLRESNLGVSSLSYAGGFTGASGMSFDEAQEDGLQAVNEARVLGADCLVVSTGPRGGHTRNHAMRIAAEGINIVANAAARADVKIALQPMSVEYADDWTFINTLDDALHLLDLCRHPNVGLSFGTMHLGCEQDIVDRIPEIADRVSLVRLGNRRHQAQQSDMSLRLMGKGIAPVDKLVAAFMDTDYSGFFEADVWSERTWRAKNYDEVLDYSARQYVNLFE